MGRPKRRPLYRDPDLGLMWECTKCGMPKSEPEFYPNPHTSSGLQSQCKDCMSEYHRKKRLGRIERLEQENADMKALLGRLGVTYTPPPVEGAD